uniref:Uncharacterized protein n=1 Tax=Lactuca sativa TaxID=4236 RepID=A0A9R1VIF9_LACSA|nr:hypothetical protein LSAT_V11C500258130 [Lactuca sativa]
MVLYATQSGSNKRCPVQPGGTESGYYMLRFLKEIVEEGIEVLQLIVTEYVNMLIFINKNNMQTFSQIRDGKVEYTTDDIDEIREE